MVARGRGAGVTERDVWEAEGAQVHCVAGVAALVVALLDLRSAGSACSRSCSSMLLSAALLQVLPPPPSPSCSFRNPLRIDCLISSPVTASVAILMLQFCFSLWP
ncbi:hypothetical protein M758_4G157800 [Ceratodon purpureus]|uniref:Uncharacterized protein n=1 Tax=Ceratodon purpureus TaxID=3225 RepID=A0A8T0IBA1_CERPU|nr:hypothetical protein KC19_4G157400 [Ceratodon purpureus]KAG0619692.1 hypothetical protein M758_4G157800 [Ceratodon purpureus]